MDRLCASRCSRRCSAHIRSTPRRSLKPVRLSTYPALRFPSHLSIPNSDERRPSTRRLARPCVASQACRESTRGVHACGGGELQSAHATAAPSEHLTRDDLFMSCEGTQPFTYVYIHSTPAIILTARVLL